MEKFSEGIISLGQTLDDLRSGRVEYPRHEIVYDEIFSAAREDDREPYDTGCENLSRYNKDWWLSPIGDMVNVVGYIIADYQLRDKSLFKHLYNKTWFDANTFIPAYMEACRRSGIKEFTMSSDLE